MESNGYKKLLADLAATKSLKNNWYLVASTTQILMMEDSAPPQVTKILKDASDACGYSTNTIQRMLSVMEFIESIRREIPELTGIDINTLSFPSLEVVKRLHQVSAEKGLKMLIEVTKGRITYRRLRKHYTIVVAENVKDASSHQTAKLQKMSFVDAAYAAVKLAAYDLCGGMYQFAFELTFSTIMQVGAVAYDKNSLPKKHPIIGFEFIVLSDPEQPRNILDLMIFKTFFVSGFFNRLWVVFGSSTGMERIMAYSQILDELNQPSIGVAILPWGDETADSAELQIIRYPKGDPSPDWRGKLDTINNLRSSLSRAKTKNETTEI